MTTACLTLARPHQRGKASTLTITLQKDDTTMAVIEVELDDSDVLDLLTCRSVDRLPVHVISHGPPAVPSRMPSLSDYCD